MIRAFVQVTLWILIGGLLSLLNECPGATATAERRMVTTTSIEGIIWGVARGAVNDEIGVVADSCNARHAAVQRALPEVTLSIDGRPRTGAAAWAEAVWRVICYVASEGGLPGDVGYGYGLQLAETNVQTTTAISDESVTKTIDVYWVESVKISDRITRRIPIYVSITIRATETGTETQIYGTGTGHADVRDFRCGVIRRIAERRAAAELDSGLRAALDAVESKARGYYSAGAMSADSQQIVAAVRDAIRIGRVRP
jgi:hypothetical protein